MVGVLTGLAVVGFHFLLGSINQFLFGTLVESIMALVGSVTTPETPLELFNPAEPESSTPLKALLQLGLGGIGFLPPPPAPPEPLPPQTITVSWLSSWPVLVVPMLGGCWWACCGSWARTSDLGCPA